MGTTQSEESVCGDNVKDSSYFYNKKVSKPKKLSATVGTVSTILGKLHARSTLTKKEMVDVTPRFSKYAETESRRIQDLNIIKYTDNVTQISTHITTIMNRSNPRSKYNYSLSYITNSSNPNQDNY